MDLLGTVSAAVYQGCDPRVTGRENNEDIFWKEIGIGRQYDLFMVKLGKRKGQVKREKVLVQN